MEFHTKMYRNNLGDQFSFLRKGTSTESVCCVCVCVHLALLSQCIIGESISSSVVLKVVYSEFMGMLGLNEHVIATSSEADLMGIL